MGFRGKTEAAKGRVMSPPHFAVRPFAAALLLTTLAACHREQAPVQGQRISFDDVQSGAEQPLPSPDTQGAAWTVSANGQAIDFGKPGEKPFLTLLCDIKSDPARITLVRHAPARPGEKALFPIIGNGTISRFAVDAALADNEWRWQGTVPADDPLLEVFGGARQLQATLPGAGELKIAGSRIPGQFVAWCRARGQGPAIEATEKPEATARD